MTLGGGTDGVTELRDLPHAGVFVLLLKHEGCVGFVISP